MKKTFWPIIIGVALIYFKDYFYYFGGQTLSIVAGLSLPLGVAAICFGIFNIVKRNKNNQANTDGVENSFGIVSKDKFEKNELPDGSIDFVFNVRKFGSPSSPYLKKFQNQLLLMIALFWFFIGMYIHRYEKDLLSSLFMAMFITPVPSWLFYKIFSRTSHTIKIIPGKGINFLGKSIPFSEISGVSVLPYPEYKGHLSNGKWVSSSDRAEPLCIIVTTNGRAVDITGGTRQYIAEKVSDEIISFKDKWSKGFSAVR